MKITAQEEYGLRCLLQLAKNAGAARPLTVREVAANEGISTAYAEKLLYQLSKAGLAQSVRGIRGGFRLKRRPEDVTVGDVVRALGSFLTHAAICQRFTGEETQCVHNKNCGLRPVWSTLNLPHPKIARQHAPHVVAPGRARRAPGDGRDGALSFRIPNARRCCMTTHVDIEYVSPITYELFEWELPAREPVTPPEAEASDVSQNDLGYFMTMAGRHELLTAEQERTLGAALWTARRRLLRILRRARAGSDEFPGEFPSLETSPPTRPVTRSTRRPFGERRAPGARAERQVEDPRSRRAPERIHEKSDFEPIGRA